MDRNDYDVVAPGIVAGSLSARRAWIEICHFGGIKTGVSVALRKESVDRNLSDLSMETLR